MKIELEVKNEVLANLMTSAIESGDPVTTFRRGGWCDGIDPTNEEVIDVYKFQKQLGRKTYSWPWYSNPTLYENEAACRLTIREVEDESVYDPDEESPQGLKVHTIGLSEIRRGLAVMAEKAPNAFRQVIEDSTDAPCADTFLQCVLFGELKYG